MRALKPNENILEGIKSKGAKMCPFLHRNHSKRSRKTILNQVKRPTY